MITKQCLKQTLLMLIAALSLAAVVPQFTLAQSPPAAKNKVDYDALPWSFRPLVEPKVPAVKDQAWPRDDLDRFILAALE